MASVFLPCEGTSNALLAVRHSVDAFRRGDVLIGLLPLGDAIPKHLVSWRPGMVAENLTHGAMTYAFVLDNFDAPSRKTSEQGRPYLLSGAASGFNESARAAALIAYQARLLGDSGEKTAKETAAAIDLRSRIRTRDGASLAESLARSTTRER